MDHEQKQRATSLLLGGITEDVVYDMLASEAEAHGNPLDEYQLEDLPTHIRRLAEQIKARGEVP